ncbi:MAG: hypothetical protein K2H52_16255 [Lachnospiraceae bacterium]|nr:hypothetical protein [Lachnospiraceae bacterium]
MNNDYAEWLEKEKSWIDEKDKKLKKQTLLYLPLLIGGSMIFFALIGILAGADLKGVLQNALIGAGIGIGAIPFFYVIMLASFPAKHYMKNLKEQVEDVLSPEEREEFASQMFGLKGSIEEFSWTDNEKFAGKRETKVRITKDYALQTSSNGAALMVQLQKVKKIVADTREYTVTTRGGGVKIQQTVTVYPLYFYYQKPEEGKKSAYDREFTFKRREDRERVSHYFNQTLLRDEECKIL